VTRLRRLPRGYFVLLALSAAVLVVMPFGLLFIQLAFPEVGDLIQPQAVQQLATFWPIAALPILARGLIANRTMHCYAESLH
jgi:hypothetical protein